MNRNVRWLAPALVVGLGLIWWPIATAGAAVLVGAAFVAGLPRTAAVMLVVFVALAAAGARIDASDRPELGAVQR